MPSAFLYPKAVLASSIRFFAVFNNLSLSSVNSWLTGAKWFIGIAIVLTGAFIFINQSTDLNTTLARISIISFCFFIP
jgi:hypothetical protein